MKRPYSLEQIVRWLEWGGIAIYELAWIEALATLKRLEKEQK